MDKKTLENKMKKYNKLYKKDFNLTLNKMINDLNPSVNISEYSKNFNNKQETDLFYYLKVKELGRQHALDEYIDIINRNEITESNGSRFFEKLNLNIGIIADEFLYESFKNIANIKYLSRNDISVDKSLDFVIFATTWRGVDNSWVGVANPFSEARKDMLNLIDLYKSEGITTVFYSKEDPVNYNLFKDMSKPCDYIYTTSQEVVNDYISYTGNENVDVLQFGINPTIHNPVGTRSKFAEQYKNKILFAGSWLVKYPVRMTETQRLFDSILKETEDLIIIDRNLELENPRYQFPSKYINNITFPVKHNLLMKLHKIFRWSINMNSVKYSETMFANRVYELQAFGNILLSNYNTGINNIFPNVRMINDKEDFKLLYNTNENDLLELQAKGIRSVMKNHTTYHRLSKIASDIGLSANQYEDAKILIIMKDYSDENIDNYERQIYENKFKCQESEISTIDLKEYDYITFFSSNILYEEYYLDDMVSAFKYVDVDFVTKNNNLEKHNYVNNINDTYLSMISTKNIQSINEIDNLNVGYNLDDVEVFKNKQEYKNRVTKDLSVIVPIHNNGSYLEEKCFASLKRSSIFEKMEIIFVNDGCTDEYTIKIINRLRRRHPDIVYIENDTGSGSASKPRNQGVKIASTDLITYLDPDNEATGDGYAHMLETIKEKNVDMVVGNIVKESNEKKNTISYTNVIKNNNYGKLHIDDPQAFLKRSEMRVQSIQALIVKKNIILDNDITMVEGAAGQDTMFFQELVLNCNSIQGVNKLIHIYYAAVSGSVTNTVSKKFFIKYLILEKERVPFLNKYGLMETYLEERFNFYIKKWYKPRLDRLQPEDRKESIKLFLDILDLYKEYQPVYDLDNQKLIEELSQELVN